MKLICLDNYIRREKYEKKLLANILLLEIPQTRIWIVPSSKDAFQDCLLANVTIEEYLLVNFAIK
jgi:hypothetical protein